MFWIDDDSLYEENEYSNPLSKLDGGAFERSLSTAYSYDKRLPAKSMQPVQDEYDGEKNIAICQFRIINN